MDSLLKELVNYGVLGIVAAILFWQMTRLQNKLLDIIENNTKAFDELKGVISQCQFIHKDK